MCAWHNFYICGSPGLHAIKQHIVEAIYYISLCGLKMFSSAQIGAPIWHTGNVLEYVCTFKVLSRTLIILKTTFLQN